MESQTRTHMCFPKLAPFTSELQGQEANSVSERTWSEKASGMVLAQSYLPVPLLKNTNWLLNKGENLGKPSTCSPTTSSCFQKWVSGPHVENIYNKAKQPVCAFIHTIYLFKNNTKSELEFIFKWVTLQHQESNTDVLPQILINSFARSSL